MNVVDKSELIPCLLDEVPVGAVFTYCGTPYIRSEVDEDGDYLAVNLKDGELMYFSADDEVVLRRDAELVLA